MSRQQPVFGGRKWSERYTYVPVGLVAHGKSCRQSARSACPLPVIDLTDPDHPTISNRNGDLLN